MWVYWYNYKINLKTIHGLYNDPRHLMNALYQSQFQSPGLNIYMPMDQNLMAQMNMTYLFNILYLKYLK